MSVELVSVDNFVRAETDRLFASLQAEAGGVNVFKHNRVPTPIDNQPVIRMNRDTLYGTAVVDISQGATVSIPEGGDRYVSVMVVNQDHYINRVLHEPGDHPLTVEEFDTPWVAVGARVLVDPGDADDVAAVNALQDRFKLDAGSSEPFEAPDYDVASLDATRKALLELARALRRIRPCLRCQGPTSIRFATCSVQQPVGAACPIRRLPTSASSPASRSANTSSP